MDEITVKGLLRITLVSHQTMLFGSGEEALLIDLRNLLASLVGLHPYDILASLKTPLLEKLSRVLEVVSPRPQKYEGRTITDIAHSQLLQLLQRHC
jgi:hypothetical protein